MHSSSRWALLCGILLCSSLLHAAERFVSLSGGHVPPFTDWAGAATNIQDAIDVSVDGDLIWVTNGVYASGGKVMAGDLTNRVALDKALTVQSVNGPYVTIIKGERDPVTTTGPGAVRCAWLTNDATLKGFTLKGGATRSTGSVPDFPCGGGVLCAGTNSFLIECIISGNTAHLSGGGVYQGTLRKCFVTGNANRTIAGSGGGAHRSALESTVVSGNSSAVGAGASSSSLTNCTVTGNFIGGGTYQSTHRNCIVYFNRDPQGIDRNWAAGIFSYSCTFPAAYGPGNISVDPKLLADKVHLAPDSPCRGTGASSGVAGLDIDGQAWANPPSMGCDEWHAEPAIGQPVTEVISGSGLVVLEAAVAGEPPFSFWWYKDGELIRESSHYGGLNSSALTINRFDARDAGAYRLVASNEFGTATSPAAHLVIHCANATASNPVWPYTNWTTAAGTIQEAIDAAAEGHIVLVTNGVYASGGKVMAGDLTNRVALDKPIVVESFNGPAATIILGGGTNGPSAVRCAWVGEGATLGGFTLQGGYTRTSGDFVTMQNGGGAWCANSKDSVIANCWIVGNSAFYSGGGAYQGIIKNSAILTNTAFRWFGGGVYGSTTLNCTIVGNRALNGGGVDSGSHTNAIIFFNSITGPQTSTSNFNSSVMRYCCSSPLPQGLGNISTDPLMLPGGVNLANSSPCRATGTNGVSSGVDLFGYTWSNPPSMGCAEWRSLPTIVGPAIEFETGPVGFSLVASLAGIEPFSYYWLRDGAVLQEDDHYTATDTAALRVKGIRSSDPGAYQLVASNAFGVTTSAVFQVTAHYVNAAGASPVPPYLTWETAATNIQDAIDAAPPGSLVLVTNGFYSTGGKVMAGLLTNRVALNKPLLVHGLNGPAVTTILGSWQPHANGFSAVRCAWLTNGAMLSGFTVRGGATIASSSPGDEASGGGVWGTNNSTVAECVIIDNMAGAQGGGVYRATVVDCSLLRNRVVTPYGSTKGGGAYGSTLRNCIVAENWVTRDGGGTAECHLYNCLLTGNAAGSSGAAVYGGTLVNCTVVNQQSSTAVRYATLTNCVVYHNLENYENSTLAYSCSSPLPPGAGNIDADPQVLNKGMYLAETSPCRGAGLSSAASGVDLQGQAWLSPPSMGCDEWHPEAVLPGPLQFTFGRNPFTLKIAAASAAGQAPLGFYWYKDGGLLEDGVRYSGASGPVLSVVEFGPADIGSYEVVVSNAFSMATSTVAQVVVRCVDIASTSPAAPYLSWANAAANIQDAIDVSEPGDFILVADGLYSSGGKIIEGDLLNRVAITRPMVVVSLGGAAATILQGEQEPGTGIGPTAVRCAWLADGAVLDGFTLQGGGTRAGSGEGLVNGGGALGFSAKSLLRDCVVQGNVAVGGGGCYLTGLDRCLVQANRSTSGGGGLYYSSAFNTLVRSNYSPSAGGAISATLINCTVTANASESYGPGMFGGTLLNSIVWNNSSRGNSAVAQCASLQNMAYSCTTLAFPNAGNISVDPQLLNDRYLTSTSPCRAAGTPTASPSGTDLDGEPWLNPPSMGCDEFYEENLRGPLAVGLLAPMTTVTEDRPIPFWGSVNGRASRVEWSFGDGSVLTNASLVSILHSWSDPGNYPLTFTAFNADYPSGVSTNIDIQVVPFLQPTLSYNTQNSTNFMLSYVGQPGVSYTLQQTMNLTPPIVWTTAVSNYGVGQIIEFIDTGLTNTPVRFYRLQAE